MSGDAGGWHRERQRNLPIRFDEFRQTPIDRQYWRRLSPSGNYAAEAACDEKAAAITQARSDFYSTLKMYGSWPPPRLGDVGACREVYDREFVGDRPFDRFCHDRRHDAVAPPLNVVARIIKIQFITQYKPYPRCN